MADFDPININITGDGGLYKRLSDAAASVNAAIQKSFDPNNLKKMSDGLGAAAKNAETLGKSVDGVSKLVTSLDSLTGSVSSFVQNGKALNDFLNTFEKNMSDLDQTVRQESAMLKGISELKSQLDKIGASASGTSFGSGFGRMQSATEQAQRRFNDLQTKVVKSAMASGDRGALEHLHRYSHDVQGQLDALDKLEARRSQMTPDDYAREKTNLIQSLEKSVDKSEKLLKDHATTGSALQRVDKILEKGREGVSQGFQQAESNLVNAFSSLKSLNLATAIRQGSGLAGQLSDLSKDWKALGKARAEGGEKGEQARIAQVQMTGNLVMTVVSTIIQALLGLDAMKAQLNQGLLRMGALNLGLDQAAGGDPFGKWREQVLKFSQSNAAIGGTEYFIEDEKVMAIESAFNQTGMSLQAFQESALGNVDDMVRRSAFLATQLGVDATRAAGMQNEIITTYGRNMNNTVDLLFGMGQQAIKAKVNQDQFIQTVMQSASKTMLYNDSLEETAAFLSNLASTAFFSGKKGLQAGQAMLDWINDSDEQKLMRVQQNYGKQADEAFQDRLQEMRAEADSENDPKKKEALNRQIQQFEASGKGIGGGGAALWHNFLKSPQKAHELLSGPLQEYKALQNSGGNNDNAMRQLAVKAGMGDNQKQFFEFMQMLLEAGADGSIGSMKSAFKSKDINAKFNELTDKASKDAWNSAKSQADKLGKMIENYLKSMSGYLGSISGFIKTVVDTLSGSKSAEAAVKVGEDRNRLMTSGPKDRLPGVEDFRRKLIISGDPQAAAKTNQYKDVRTVGNLADLKKSSVGQEYALSGGHLQRVMKEAGRYADKGSSFNPKYFMEWLEKKGIKGGQDSLSEQQLSKEALEYIEVIRNAGKKTVADTNSGKGYLDWMGLGEGAASKAHAGTPMTPPVQTSSLPVDGAGSANPLPGGSTARQNTAAGSAPVVQNTTLASLNFYPAPEKPGASAAPVEVGGSTSSAATNGLGGAMGNYDPNRR
jgi:hypothetical protein